MKGNLQDAVAGTFPRIYSGTEEITPHLVISGDFNICHQAIDIHDPVRNVTNSDFSRRKENGSAHSFTAASLIPFVICQRTTSLLLVELPGQRPGTEPGMEDRLPYGE
jgi:hypothetical protein